MKDFSEIYSQYLDKKAKHAFYEAAVAIRDEVRIHADKEYPEEILQLARPSETPEQKEYRRNAYASITVQPFERILTNIAKIPRSQGFQVSFPNELSARVLEGFEPRLYFEKDYPQFDSLQNYLFGYLVRQSVVDPNAVIAVYPKEWDKGQAVPLNTYPQPFAYVYQCHEVLDMVEGEYAIILKDEKSTVQVGDNYVSEGNILIYFDRSEFVMWTQTGKKESNNYDEFRVPFPSAYLPVFKLGSGNIGKLADGYVLYKSVIDACLESWKEAVRRYSDHQVNMVRHVHPKEWQEANIPCTASGCKEGIVEHRPMGIKPYKETCKTCHGSGRVAANSPFNVIYKNPVKGEGMQANASMSTGAPGGYIEQNTEALQFLKQEYKDKVLEGMEALGLGMLSEIPLNQSGRAKEYDRQEINTFFYSFARHMVENIYKNIVFFTLMQRYGYFVPQNEIDNYFDAVTFKIPTSFDLVSSEYDRERASNARKEGLSLGIVAAAELAYARKEYGEDSFDYQLLAAKYELDPLPGMMPADKLEASMGGISKEAYLISTQLEDFIREAYDADETFFEKTRAEKKAILQAMATKQTGQNALQLAGVGFSDAPTDTPNDVEAEAAAKLKGSVGGSQVIQSYAEKVVTGVIDYDAAVQGLIFLFKVDQAQAEALLGSREKLMNAKQDPAAKAAAGNAPA